MQKCVRVRLPLESLTIRFRTSISYRKLNYMARNVYTDLDLNDNKILNASNIGGSIDTSNLATDLLKEL